jgi:hypothetical protein
MRVATGGAGRARADAAELATLLHQALKRLGVTLTLPHGSIGRPPQRGRLVPGPTRP